MAKYYIRVGTVPAEVIQPPMDIDSLFTHFKSRPPEGLNPRGIDSLVNMGYYETAGDEEFYAFVDTFFMVKSPAAIDFYLYKESVAPAMTKPQPPKEAA
jgi:hypothetical protein